MKKAIIEFVGRLGNQMYSYCTAMRLKENKYSVKYDMEYFNWWPKKRKHVWTNELRKFNVSLPVATKQEIDTLLTRTNNRYINGLLKKKKYFSKKVIWLKERKDVENFPDQIYILGFEANLPFIQKNINKIRKAFTLRKQYKKSIINILEEVSNCESVCINVRRGDLLKYKDANILPIDYYKKAIYLLEKKLKKTPIYYITSDEIAWCKDNFQWIENKKFLEYHGYENLEIAKNCKHDILANSTFSWWVAILNSYKNKIIIAPKKFYIRNGQKKINWNEFPDEWIMIN